MERPASLEPLVLRFHLPGFLSARSDLAPDDRTWTHKVLLTKVTRGGTRGR
jgi:hypothetical protein